jgi:hypothetical protein
VSKILNPNLFSKGPILSRTWRLISKQKPPSRSTSIHFARFFSRHSLANELTVSRSTRKFSAQPQGDERFAALDPIANGTASTLCGGAAKFDIGPTKPIFGDRFAKTTS